MYTISCKHCGYLGEARELKRHLDGRKLLCCPACRRTQELTILGINASGGQTFGRTDLKAGGHMSLYKRGAGKGEE